MAAQSDEIRELQARNHALEGLVENLFVIVFAATTPELADRLGTEIRKGARRLVLATGADPESSSSAAVLAQAAYSSQVAELLIDRALKRSAAIREINRGAT